MDGRKRITHIAMIYLNIDDREFYDDAVVLVRSFYPRTEVGEYDRQNVTPEDIIIRPDIPEKEGRSRSELHEEFKTDLYKKLEKMTGRTLPWGKLTGVRPSKIAVNLIENKTSDEDIIKLFMDKHYASEAKAKLALGVAHKELGLLGQRDYINGYSLYIGIPFCPTTCLYCSFTSYSIDKWHDRVEEYLSALFCEMEFVAAKLKNRRLDTIYFGGGTPTTLSADQLDRLLGHMEKCFDMSDIVELTVEAGRPDSLTIDKLKVLKAHNVGRISINPQTMNQATLDIIGRKHTVEQVKEAFAMAHECGLDNINVDLIMGLPGEDEAMIHHTLDEVKKLAPTSLTVHSLAIKRASRLSQWILEHGISTLHNTDETMAIAAQGAKQMGMEPYYLYRQKNMSGNFENVGYAKPGKAGIYNILIMEEVQTIMALGAGTISKRVYGDGRIERCDNVKDVGQYIERIDEMIQRKQQLFSEE